MPKDKSRAHLIRGIFWGLLAIIILILLFAVRRPATIPSSPPAAENTPLADPTIETSVLSGTVASVGGGFFTLNIPSIFGIAIAADSPLANRRVVVSLETIIVIETRKTDDAYAKEIQTYNNAIAKGRNSLPPVSYTEQTISFADLSVGDSVVVYDVNGINIKTRETFTAGKVVKK